MKNISLAISALALVGAVGFSATRQSDARTTQPRRADMIARGNYLVNTMGCHDCHTPFKMGSKGPEPDMTQALTGHPEQIGPLPAAVVHGPWLMVASATNTAFSGPWGVSYAANLTPDQNTGLGIWTEDMFLKAIRTGRHMGVSRPINPPMPWPVFRNATDEDLKAIFAYLGSLKPVTNHVPTYEPPAENDPRSSN